MKKMKKGFTLVELVTVIAVIAVLAAVLIPTFSGIVQRANYTADTTTVKTVNDYISSSTTPTNMDEVNALIKEESEGKLSLETLPQKSGHQYAWEATTNEFVMLDGKCAIVYPEEAKNISNPVFWLLVSSANQVKSYEDVTLNYYMKNSFSGNITLSELASFDTGVSTLTGSVTINTTETGDATIAGKITNTVTVNAPNAAITHEGNVKKVVVNEVADHSYYAQNLIVETLQAIKGHVEISGESFVKELALPANAQAGDLTITNKATIADISVGTQKASTATSEAKMEIPAVIVFDTTQGKIEAETTNVTVGETGEIVESAATLDKDITSLEDLERFRDMVNAGARLEDSTYTLRASIALPDGWTPIGAFTRNYVLGGVKKSDAAVGFAGIFDGNKAEGYKITNLNNIGFTPIADTMLSKNASTRGNANEYAYGFFGCVDSATIKNLVIEDVNIKIDTKANQYGDSVGAIAGYAHGATITNCVVKGTQVSARDGVGAILGRSYGDAITITGCEAEIDVNGQSKAAGILGYVNVPNGNISTISGNTFTGNVTASRAGDLIQNDPLFAAGIVNLGSTTAADMTVSNNLVIGDIKVQNNTNSRVEATANITAANATASDNNEEQAEEYIGSSLKQN